MKYFIIMYSTAILQKGIISGFLCSDGQLNDVGEVFDTIRSFDALKRFRNGLNLSVITKLEIIKTADYATLSDCYKAVKCGEKSLSWF